jgi:hypothetical protein
VKPYERTNYFDGVLLVADDLKREQTYYQGRLDGLARRAGPGVLCGLEVKGNGDATGVTVEPGRAIDSSGRELALEEPQDWPLTCWPEDGADEMFLCLQFDECRFLERVQALRHDGGCDAGASGDEAGVVVAYLEAAKLCLTTEQELPSPGWRRAGGMNEPARTARPDAPGLVPIVRLVRAPDRSCLKVVETLGRPIVTICDTITRITCLSWRHGGEFDPAEGLTLTFNRPLWQVPRPAALPPLPDPVLRLALRLIFEGPDGTLRCLGPSADELAFVDEDPTRLRWRLEDRSGLLPADALVRVRLACAFVLDEAGVPVSGAHLGGLLPSGDGIAGSDFESWFTVKRAAKAKDAAEAPP